MNDKVLLFDIETAPLLSYVWGLWEQNVLRVESDWYILCFAAKWLDEKKIMTSALPDYPLYKKSPENDKEVIKALWKLFDEADILIGHNGDPFDIKKTNARFIAHGMKPPSPYKTVDTLKVARRYFKFDSNKLDELGRYLKIGRKVHTGGMKLWFDCMSGKPEAWRKMVRYNRQDVVLLEEVYLKLRPWMINHPNEYRVDETKRECPIPSCGGKLQRRGPEKTASGMSFYYKYSCNDCGKWLSGKTQSIKFL